MLNEIQIIREWRNLTKPHECLDETGLQREYESSDILLDQYKQLDSPSSRHHLYGIMTRGDIDEDL